MTALLAVAWGSAAEQLEDAFPGLPEDPQIETTEEFPDTGSAPPDDSTLDLTAPVRAAARERKERAAREEAERKATEAEPTAPADAPRTSLRPATDADRLRAARAAGERIAAEGMAKSRDPGAPRESGDLAAEAETDDDQPLVLWDAEVAARVGRPSPLRDAGERQRRIEHYRPKTLGRPEDALLPPNLHLRWRRQLAELCERLADYDTALAYYEEIIGLGDNDVAAWRGLGRMRLRTGDLEGAEAAFLAAYEVTQLEGRPDAEVSRELGELYLLARKPANAVLALERAIELAPNRARLTGLLARGRFENDPENAPAPEIFVALWTEDASGAWRERLTRMLGSAHQLAPPALVRWMGRAATPEGMRVGLAVICGLMALLVLLHFVQGHADLVVSIDYPSELRGTFTIRLAGQRAQARRSAIADRAQILAGGSSSRSTHHLVSRETQFRRLRPRRYYVVTEGVLQDPSSDDVLSDVFEEQLVQLKRSQTSRVDFGVHPADCPVDVQVMWDRKLAKDALVAAHGLPGSLRYARGGPVRMQLPPGEHTIVVGSGDRVAECQVQVQGYRPTPVEVDLTGAADVIFKGCPPAVEPYVHGDVRGAARALGRDGHDDVAHVLLARMHRDQGQPARAAEHFEQAGHELEAAEIYASLAEHARAAELFERAGDDRQAGEMYRAAGQLVPAGNAFEAAGDFEGAVECYREAGELGKWLDAMERNGDYYHAAEIALAKDDRARAIRLFQLIAPSHERYAQACFKLAEVLETEGHIELAARKLEELIAAPSSNPEGRSPDVHSRLAELLEADDQLSKAMQVLEDLREREPTYPHVATRIESLRLKKSQQEREERADSRARSLTPTAFLAESRYEILCELGRGGMGIVYQARDNRLGRVVALKQLPENLRDHPKATQLFLREAQSCAQLNHRNIVTIYDTDQENGVFFITMELLEGYPLSVILRRKKRIAIRDLAHIGAQVASGLSYAHERRIVHRDIKTANLFFTNDKVMKIMDFGLAKVVEEVRRASTVIGGTPYYMAPEQAAGESVDHRADIYAFGVTLFELATGSVPFREGDVTYKHRHTQAPDPRSLVEDLPSELADLILHMMQKSPDDRPQSAADVQERLTALLHTTKEPLD